MNQCKLTTARVAALKPRRRDYVVRDLEVPGFGVRVYPNGRKLFFAQTQNRVQNRGRRRQKSFGHFPALSLIEARRMARAFVAPINAPEPTPLPKLFEDVGETLLHRYARNWKPSTHASSRRYYDQFILPFFSETPIAEIDERMVRRWFASLGNRPGQANRALPVLSVLMAQAEAYGYRPPNSNPCKGIPRYKMAPKERFLSADELARLGAALRAYPEPSAAAYIHLLVLTGCRKGELAGLRWTDYRHGRLYLTDSKTGAKTVYLSAPARGVLDGLPRTGARVFDIQVNPHWKSIRAEAGLDGVRLHDLRHTYASHALAVGEHILTIGKLLGHRDPETTFKYAHLADAHVQKTACSVSAAIAKGM